MNLVKFQEITPYLKKRLEARKIKNQKMERAPSTNIVETQTIDTNVNTISGSGGGSNQIQTQHSPNNRIEQNKSDHDDDDDEDDDIAIGNAV